MRFSVNWLKQWVDIKDLDAQALADRLTESGLEVDECGPVAAIFSDVVIAEVVGCEPHPDADKLRVCQVNDGGDTLLQIVCGAPNAAVGLKAPLARVGAVLGDGSERLKIRKAKLRGVESFGMLCSGRELGLSEDHDGLLALPETAPVGDSLYDYLQLDDSSIEVDLTPNRADCLSIRGLAQDVAASCRTELTPPLIEAVEAVHEDSFPVQLSDAAACPRYVGRVIRGIDPSAQTPLWMVEKLRRCGLRSISPVVDVTNYVLIELGQPMHAFDYQGLQGGIDVRYARSGEQLVLLDGKEVALDDDILLITDASGPVALAGIMGGLSTAVSETTQDIFLESAFFAPAVIMGKARQLGMHTDASHRFERGVDPSGQELAVEYATRLLLDIVGGQPGPVEVTEEPAHVPRTATVNLRLARLNRVLGSQLDIATVEDILQRLGMRVEQTQDGVWQVQPSAARFDIAIEEDLIEEVARIYGYNQLPAALPSGELAVGTDSERQIPLQEYRASLIAGGYQEAITYSFIDTDTLQAFGLAEMALPLANPLSSDQSVMRTALLPGLVEALQRNLNRQQDRVRLFEIGVAFEQGETLTETLRIAAAACGPVIQEQWAQSPRAVDFYDLKNDVENLLALRGLSAAAHFTPVQLAWLHPGRSAQVVVDGQTVGYLGELHPTLQKQLQLDKPVYVFELDLDLIINREIPNAKEISRFPSVRRDLALVVPESVKFEEIRAIITKETSNLLKNLLVFDVYTGENIEKGYKSLAIGLIFQDVSSTLKDEIVENLKDSAVAALEAQLGAKLRG